MHELSICQAMLDQVDAIARAHGARQVEEITVAVGPLSGVEPDLLGNAFELARRGCCAQAALRFEPAPVRVHCDDCGAEAECRPNALVCSACGGWRTHVVSGDQLLLLRVRLSADTVPVH